MATRVEPPPPSRPDPPLLDRDGEVEALRAASRAKPAGALTEPRAPAEVPA